MAENDASSIGTGDDKDKAPNPAVEWRNLFGAPETEELIEDFSCAILKRNFPHHGRMYVSTANLYFRSSIFGNKTQLKTSLGEIVGLVKTTTNIINPAIEVTTWRHKYLFASFVNRDKTHRTIEKAWTDFRSKSRKKLVSSDSNCCTSNLVAQCVATQMADANTTHSELPDEVKMMFRDEASNPGEAGSPATSPRSQLNQTPRVPGIEGDDNGLWSDDDTQPVERDLICDAEVTLNVLPAAKPRAVSITECSLEASPFQVAQLLAGEICGEFWDAYMGMTERTDVKYGGWSAYSGQSEMREITCIQNGVKAPAFVPNVPKSTRCIELQRRTMPCINNFTLDSSVQTPDVPLGDHFTIEIRYEVTGVVGLPVDILLKGNTVSYPFTRSKLSVTMEASWIKIPWIGKTAVEGNVQGVVSARHKIFVELLQQKIQEMNLGPVAPTKNIKRRRRGHDSVVSQHEPPLNDDSPSFQPSKSNDPVDTVSPDLTPQFSINSNPCPVPSLPLDTQLPPQVSTHATKSTATAVAPTANAATLNTTRSSTSTKSKDHVESLTRDMERLRLWVVVLTVFCLLLCLAVVWLWLDVSMIRKIGITSLKDALQHDTRGTAGHSPNEL